MGFIESIDTILNCMVYNGQGRRKVRVMGLGEWAGVGGGGGAKSVQVWGGRGGQVSPGQSISLFSCAAQSSDG